MIRAFVSSAIMALTCGGSVLACETDAYASFLSRGPQTPIVIDSLKTESGREVFVFVLTTMTGPQLVGERAKKFVYLVMTSGDPACIAEAVSLGSYAAHVRSDGRRFHLDHYANGRHATLGFFDTEPSRQEIDSIALSVLN